MSDYLSDFHLHSRFSPDSRATMTEMAEAAAARGVRELCFTDHVELFSSKSHTRNTFEWSVLADQWAGARGDLGVRMIIRRGVELGEAPRDFPYAEELLREMPPLDFIIGSIHQLSESFGCEDLAYAASGDEAVARRQIEDYLELVYRQAKWGKFSVLGHLTLPLRYINERRGGHMTFDGYESQVADIYRALMENGCGIELNVNRGSAPLPGEKLLRLYRSMGGEIITVGTDAHRPEHAGAGVAEGLELLRRCGFRAYCTFQDLKPVFHDL